MVHRRGHGLCFAVAGRGGFRSGCGRMLLLEGPGHAATRAGQQHGGRGGDGDQLLPALLRGLGRVAVVLDGFGGCGGHGFSFSIGEIVKVQPTRE